MIERYENKYSMHRTVELVLDTNNLIWNANVGFVAVKTAYSGKLTDIFNVSQQQNAVISGIAVDKKELKKALVAVTAPIAAAVIVHATQTNNNQLLGEVNFSDTELSRKRDDEIAQVCQNIHDRANDNIAAITVLGITAPMLVTQQTAIDVYEAKVPTPGAAKAAKKALAIQLRTLFKSTDNILKLELDNLMKQYKTSHPNFFDAYKAARVIHDLGATHTRMRATVKDENGQVLAHASVSLLQGNLIIYQVVSDAEGKVKLTKIKPGTYTLKVHKTNFNTSTEEGVLFKAGKEVKRTVTLTTASAPPSYISISKESDVGPNIVHNVDITELNPTPTSTVTIEITGGPLSIYGATSNNAMPGAVHYDLGIGTVTITILEFATLVGVGNGNNFLNVYNAGPNSAHYKITFTNLEP